MPTSSAPSQTYTPGEWLLTKNGSADFRIHLADGSPIATVGDEPHDGWPEAVEMNARLIRAAPELSATLNELIKMARLVVNQWDSGGIPKAVRNLDRVAREATILLATLN